ncbi:carboxypeptidase-like regulatory domain-containing protein [Deinococcus oregonensis]|uniref:Carboxypeptidase-like regulatory domain-containing protein n=1 Tax=Deinococcus oregonensis TaxID=1805970 RepID=A0ABV6ATU6_9DEIO
MSRTLKSLSSSLLLTLILASCGGGDGASSPPPSVPTPVPTPSSPKAQTMSGVVRNSAGQPLAGATVFAGHTVLFNVNALTTSGADGSYSVSVAQPAGSWYAGAQIKRRYNGADYTFDLQPDKTDPFPGTQGAIRDFSWKLTGTRPDGGKYGATLTVYADFFDPELLDWIPDMEVTLIPDGPLIDGSVGQTIRRRLIQTPDGQEGLMDIPLGTYVIRARYAPAGGAARDLSIRLRNTGDFATSVVSAFRQKGSDQLLEVEVSRQ